MPVYRIRHSTLYRHGTAAAMAWQSLRLQPRREANQECLEFELELNPRPADLSVRTDYFGNTQHVFTVRAVHREFSIQAHSLVRRDEPARPAPEPALTAAATSDAIDREVLQGDFALEQYRHPSPLVPSFPAVGSLTGAVDPALPLLEWMDAFGAVFSRTFRFDSTATLVSTPLEEVLRLRRGVCQDFAHLYIAGARSLGLAAAYVSGYLLTQPPPGRPRFVGADAMHAWVSIHVPGAGWIDYDPTNRCFAGSGHLVVARGRDYSDVSPTRGVFNGGGAQTLYLGVTVEPEDVTAP
jgi:transglutaminase-like putative cysteine protease